MMKINSLFSNPQDINIHNYLQKCGVDDVDEYLKGGKFKWSSKRKSIFTK